MRFAEMARCLRLGGRLALADVFADEDPEVARRQNDIERMRDSSHTRTLTVREIVAEMERLWPGADRGAGVAGPASC